MKKLSDVQNAEELIAFLQKKGCNHYNYYHYTNWDSLNKIVKNRTFLLTRGNSMHINDQHEAIMKGSKAAWDRTYIGSFSYGREENMAMWGLYGLPWEDAVRIRIPKEQMVRWISNINRVGLWDGKSIVGWNYDIAATLNDIVYVSGESGGQSLNLTHADDHFSTAKTPGLSAIDRNPKMTGYIKSYAWEYEKEVRIRIQTGEALGTEKIAIEIPPEVIDALTVTVGPSFTYKADELYNQLHKENRISESGYLGLVNLKSLCSMCKFKKYAPSEM